MLNLYANQDQNGIMSLLGKNTPDNSHEIETNNRRIVSGFAVLSLLILSVIANGSQYQTSFEQQRQSTISSYSTVA